MGGTSPLEDIFSGTVRFPSHVYQLPTAAHAIVNDQRIRSNAAKESHSQGQIIWTAGFCHYAGAFIIMPSRISHCLPSSVSTVLQATKHIQRHSHRGKRPIHYHNSLEDPNRQDHHLVPHSRFATSPTRLFRECIQFIDRGQHRARRRSPY